MSRSGVERVCGHWSGYWESGTTRHHGPLNGTFTQTDPAHYRVVFTGRFF